MTKRDVEAILDSLKEYVKDLLSGWGLSDEEKSLVAFEQKYMPYTEYSGKQAIDHVLFRKFLRLLNGMYSIDAYTKSDIDEMLKKKSDKADFTKYTISIEGKYGKQTITFASMQSDESQTE